MPFNPINYTKLLYIFSVAFGEMELSPLTIIILIGLTVFTFLAVGISSLKLVQSAFEKEEGES